MPAHLSKPCTAFVGHRVLAAGPLTEVALAIKTAVEQGTPGTILAFDDATGSVIDFDLRGSDADIVARLSRQADGTGPARVAGGAYVNSKGVARGRGRPRLGVVAREVTLLPRHWDWLADQPGGASAALRRLVEAARRADGGKSEARARRDAAYRFMAAMAGDLPEFEEATRALFADDRVRLERHMAAWPDDVRSYALKLAPVADAQARQ